ncbi:RyR domain-containing protein [Duganella qianjiadongensis]|uniref:Ryanodine receptor Ryr domain-containing protein n=1 Tax=Duganella qianjiadongensis TaxID=2692176 RepID=A0ABW9VRQ9_9BURK|nr:RyR domain-containing protein [Duganella qianjiadongensis]MYM42016.1 hypothetical protein [Duganella qianjiadongensis]
MSYLNRFKYVLIALQILLCITLAYAGITSYYRDRAELITPAAAGFKALQFVLPNDKNKYDDPSPLTLTVAKLWINLLMGYAVFRGMLLVARNEYNKFMTGFTSGHTVLIGLHLNSHYFTLDFLRHYPDQTIVVLANETERNLGHLLQQNGARIIYADWSDAAVWDFLNVYRLRRLIIFTDNDERNLELAKSAFNYLTSRAGGGLEKFRSRKHPFEMWTHLDNTSAGHVAEKSPVFTTKHRGYAARTFSTATMLARSLLQLAPPDCSPAFHHDRPPRFLVLGGGARARALTIELSRHCHYPGLFVPDIVWVAGDADDLLRTIRFEVPAVDQFCKIVAYQINPLQVGTAFYAKLEEQAYFTQVFLTLESEVENFILARHIGRAMKNHQTPLIMVIRPAVDSLLPAVSSTTMAPAILNIKNPLHLYSVDKTAANTEAILNQRLDQHARAIHEAYVQEQLKYGEQLGAWESLQHWDDLPETYRVANRAQAEHLAVKLRILGITLQQDQSAVLEALRREGRRLTSEPGYLEKLAEMEHRRWNADRWLSGWQYHSEKNNDLKHHHNLLPYQQLSEADKQKDRDTFLGIQQTLQQVGAISITVGSKSF